MWKKARVVNDEVIEDSHLKKTLQRIVRLKIQPFLVVYHLKKNLLI